MSPANPLFWHNRAITLLESCPERRTQQVEKVSVNFASKNLTGNSGLIPIVQFAERLGIEKTLRSELKGPERNNLDP